MAKTAYGMRMYRARKREEANLNSNTVAASGRSRIQDTEWLDDLESSQEWLSNTERLERRQAEYDDKYKGKKAPTIDSDRDAFYDYQSLTGEIDSLKDNIRHEESGIKNNLRNGVSMQGFSEAMELLRIEGTGTRSLQAQRKAYDYMMQNTDSLGLSSSDRQAFLTAAQLQEAKGYSAGAALLRRLANQR